MLVNEHVKNLVSAISFVKQEDHSNILVFQKTAEPCLSLHISGLCQGRQRYFKRLLREQSCQSMNDSSGSYNGNL